MRNTPIILYRFFYSIFQMGRRNRFVLLLFVSLFLCGWSSFIARSGRAQSERSPIQIGDGYPRFQLQGQPFFAHSAAFFYNRIPREEWGPSLVKLKSMGINTIDLYLAWNWHEPEEGKLDFEGRSNPRRDVKRLLEMTEQMGFAVIARPGPVILNEWRNGGYPDWLLSRPEFQMNAAARLDGHYPPLAGVGASNSEEASRQWLANETHLKYTRKWFADVMREVLAARQSTAGGNLIAIQLDDDQAINRTNYNGPIFWRYMNTLGGYLREAGATVPLYINPTDMRVSAAGTPHRIGAMGQWYFNFGADPALRWEDSATVQFYTETLKTQADFPPMIIEYQAGWYGTGEDAYAKTADPTNTLLSSRLLLGHGARGLNYFPVQDTLYPAGYEVPWANHHYTWESALTLDGQERARASAIHRNGRLIEGLGRELASVHKVADLGLIYPISSYDQASLTREDILRISRAQMQVQQYCQLNQVSVEYIDLEFQPLEMLKRHKALLLPIFDETTAATGREEISAANEPANRQGDRAGKPAGKKLQLSEAARQKLVAFVKAGGKLIVTPSLPEENELKALSPSLLPNFWKDLPLEPAKMKREDVIAAVKSNGAGFAKVLQAAGVTNTMSFRVRTGKNDPDAIEPNLMVTRLVSSIPAKGKQAEYASLVNFDSQKTMEVVLMYPTHNAAQSASQNIHTLDPIRIRPRDALFLPLEVPIVEGREERVCATAELIHREMSRGRIILRLYAPEPAAVTLNLPHAPQGKVNVNGVTVTARYNPDSKTLEVPLPAAPMRKPDEVTERRENEQEVVIEYETRLPHVTVNPIRLVAGESNSIQVQVYNPAAKAINGRLKLMIEGGFNTSSQEISTTIGSQESKPHTFSLPLAARAVPGDWKKLHAVFTADGQSYFSSPVQAEIHKRFDWRIYPAVTWPIRADSKQAIRPPLIYPMDDNATTATFNVRFLNHMSKELNLSRQSMLVNALPMRLQPEEEILTTYTYKFEPNTKSVLHPFRVTASDGTLTENIEVNFVALRKGEAIAFAYDIDRDGFEDYVLENEFLRLIVSPNAGGRAFALIDKRSGKNVFTSVGGLRDKFVELDPQDPTRNPRRKRGAYGTFDRPYAAQIVEGMGKQVTLKLSYDAPDIYPAGARIERAVVLQAGEQYVTVDYRITPNAGTADGRQAFWTASSIIAGDPVLKVSRFVTGAGGFEFAAMKNRVLDGASGWLAVPIDAQTTFGLFWREEEVEVSEVEMKEFSSILNLKFKPLSQAETYSYRVAYSLGALRPDQFSSLKAKITREWK